MNRYSFDTQHGHSTVVDLENTIAVSWENGRYNETNRIEYAGDSLDVMELARLSRELSEYVALNYPELV